MQSANPRHCVRANPQERYRRTTHGSDLPRIVRLANCCELAHLQRRPAFEPRFVRIWGKIRSYGLGSAQVLPSRGRKPAVLIATEARELQIVRPTAGYRPQERFEPTRSQLQ